MRGGRAPCCGPPLAPCDSSCSTLKELVDKGDRHAALADGGRRPLDGTQPDISAGEHAWKAGLPQEGVPVEQPPANLDHVVARQNIASRVAGDRVRQPLRLRASPDEARAAEHLAKSMQPCLSDNLIVQPDIATEALNRAWYERNAGRLVTDVQRWVQHPANRSMAATVDGMVEDPDAVFEAKFMLPWSFSEEAAAEKHMAQLQHNMWVVNARWAALTIITGGGKWIEMTIPADALYHTFW